MAKNKKEHKIRSDAQASIALILKTAEYVLDNDPRASIEDIAVAANLSRMTIYRHFKNRDELLEILTIESFNEAILTLDNFNQSIPFDEALKKLTLEFLRPSAKWRVIAHHPRQSSKLKNLTQAFYDRIDEVMKQGVRSKKINPSNNLIWARHAYLGLVSQAKRKEKTLNMENEKLSALIVSTFLYGLEKL